MGRIPSQLREAEGLVTQEGGFKARHGGSPDPHGKEFAMAAFGHPDWGSAQNFAVELAREFPPPQLVVYHV